MVHPIQYRIETQRSRNLQIEFVSHDDQESILRAKFMPVYVQMTGSAHCRGENAFLRRNSEYDWCSRENLSLIEQ